MYVAIFILGVIFVFLNMYIYIRIANKYIHRIDMQIILFVLYSIVQVCTWCLTFHLLDEEKKKEIVIKPIVIDYSKTEEI